MTWTMRFVLCLFSFLTLTVNLVAIVNARRTYIIASEPVSSTATLQCPENYTVTDCLTLNELIVGVSEGNSAFISGEEVTFQSGLHIVSDTNKTSLEVISRSGLSLIGETSNVTIKCLQEFYFNFTYTSVKISNITFHNCHKYMYLKFQARGEVSWFWINCTLIFEDTAGNITVDNVQIMNDIGSELQIKFDSLTTSHLQLKNLKLLKTNLHVLPPDTSKSKSLAGRKVEIIDSQFDDSCISFQTIDEEIMAIRNTTFRNCSCESVMTFLTNTLTQVYLQNVNITDNKSPYVIQARLANIRITGHSNFFHHNLGAMYVEKSMMVFSHTDVEFINNTVHNTHSVPMYITDNSTVYFVNSQVLFKNNRGSRSGAIVATEMTQLIFGLNTTINFMDNKGVKGGALSFYKQSVMRVDSSRYPESVIKLLFVSNLAIQGGGIFVQDKSYFTVVGQKLSHSVFAGLISESQTVSVSITLNDNKAQVGGNQIYGGWIDWSVDEQSNTVYNQNITRMLDFINGTDVSSDPTRVCVCFNNTPNCSVTEHSIDIYGQAFSIDLVAVGQRGGRVTSFVGAYFENDQRGDIESEEKVQTVQRNCTTLRYTLLSIPNDEVTITYRAVKNNFLALDQKELENHPDYAVLFQQLSVQVKISNCPMGFTRHEKDGHCICDNQLLELNLECDTVIYQVKRAGHQWIGVTYEHNLPGQHYGVIAHQQCPFDYCRTDNESLLIDLEDDLNLQCARNRSGTLCGACAAGFSKMLGSSKCMKCSNKMVLAAVPTFILSGLLLVIFLTLLNLTVSVGTINGLIFHVNILRAQQDVHFSGDASKSFLSTFIAWLNLDQGIEMCFYNGFDAYTSTWLQFFFPLYIWFIAAVLIISSHYSSRISKLVGKNAVQVLATLFLLSYAKVLRLIIDVFSFTTITFPDGFVKRLWLINGNMEYLKGKHLPLLLVTLLFLTVTLPYTFVLLTIQLLYKISHYRVMRWVQKLKPFFDAYTGPYKSAHRYWTGLLFVARIILLVTFSVNTNDNATINLMAIITVSTLLLGWSSSVHWVYESSINNILETFFLTNMIITSAGVLYNLSNKINSPVAIYLSSSITFLTFIAIILYHAIRQLQQTKLGLRLKKIVLEKTLIQRMHNSRPLEEDAFEVEDRRQSFSLNQRREACVCSTTKVQQKVNEVYTGSDLNEPLLED